MPRRWSRSQGTGQITLNGGAGRRDEIVGARGRKGLELQDVPGEPEADALAGVLRVPDGQHVPHHDRTEVIGERVTDPATIEDGGKIGPDSRTWGNSVMMAS
jgi:hypothetical protein